MQKGRYRLPQQFTPLLFNKSYYKYITMIPPKAIAQANFVEVIEQMTLLRYKNGETVFYRAFTGNDVRKI
jgi:hypothetical protein